MKLALIFLSSLMLSATPVWLTDFDRAKQEAAGSNKSILISFSGSDWCIPCIKMEKQLFGTETFTNYASKNLVLVKADFPRLKKNKLSKDQAVQNEHLAGLYNPQGKFPYTVLVDKDGNVMKEWDGLPSANPDAFVADINKLVHAGN